MLSHDCFPVRPCVLPQEIEGASETPPELLRAEKQPGLGIPDGLTPCLGSHSNDGRNQDGADEQSSLYCFPFWSACGSLGPRPCAFLAQSAGGRVLQMTVGSPGPLVRISTL